MSKGLEALKDIKECLFWSDKGLQDIATIEKELKALEIIKNIGILKPYETSGGHCWLETMCDAVKIVKENCDLLKEVLL